MSSEMRDAVKALEAEYRKRATNRAEDGWVTLVNCANDLRALLARTEAGADGVDTFAEWLATGMPAGTVIGNPAWWANRIARQYRVRSGVTHPQDASGDAEALQDLMTTVRAVAFSGDYGISDEAIAALSDALDDAMQAKEAK